MKTFIHHDSIVKKIWSTTDVTLFIFAGAAAEFALNREVDWLFYTGKLPADPIGRLFSTVQYAQLIIFSDEKKALGTIDNINSIHHSVESSRGRSISEEAYKDVLFMLIYYSMAAYELLERKLTEEEKNEVVHTFSRIGERMHLQVPGNYTEWLQQYQMHVAQNLLYSHHTRELFLQYRKHLGAIRYFIVLEVQRLLVSNRVNTLLSLGKPVIIKPFIFLYRLIRKLGVSWYILLLLVPRKFHPQLRKLRNR